MKTIPKSGKVRYNVTKEWKNDERSDKDLGWNYNRIS